MRIFSFKKRGGKPDYFLLATIFALVIFGLIALSSASSDLGKIRFDDTYYYLKHQVFYGLSIGLAGFFLGYLVYYRFYKKIALILLLLSLAGLMLVLFSPLGFSAGTNATRWLRVGFINFQPSELLKITFIMYLAAWLSYPGGKRQNNFLGGFLPFLILAGSVAFLLILQPATTMGVIILAAALVVYFVSGARFAYIAFAVLLGAAVLAALVYSGGYRLERFANFLSPERDIQNTGFHLNQALITLGSGGLTGVGYGRSTNKYLNLPESIGDSIFAIIGEELGFVGAAVLVFIFFILILRGIAIAKRAPDDFGRLLMVGFTSVIAVQVFVNVAAISGLIPLTGVPLPFISYGGTSLAVFMTMSGIMLNISKYA